MSQCKRVDVWTWQDGLDSAWHSYIDAIEIEEGDHNVPLPDRTTPIPLTWKSAGSDQIFANQSGTLVVWSELDKIQWKTGHTIIEHTSREVGRIHRHFLDAEMITIRAAAFLQNRPAFPSHETHITANDPLYLMKPTSTPPPWDREAMFTEWPTREYRTTVDGREVAIEVKYSIVRPEALARIHRCGAALGLEQGVRAVGRDGPRSIPINGAGGGLWLELVAPMAVLGSGAGAGSAGQHAREDNRGPGRRDSVGWLSSLVDVSGAVGAVRQAMAGLAIEPGRE